MKQIHFSFILTLTLTLTSLSFPKFVSAAVAVNWGAPANQPLFTISNLAPGQSVSKTITVQNTDKISQDISVLGTNKSDPGSLADVLLLSVAEKTHPLFNSLPLSHLFQTSHHLSQLKSGSETQYTFTVTFDDSAGNMYQNQLLAFDLQLGTSTPPLPSKCFGLPTPDLYKDCLNNTFRYRYYLLTTSLNLRLQELTNRLNSLFPRVPR